MGQSLDIPRVIPGDWKRLDLIVNKIKFKLGHQSSPTFTGLTLSSGLLDLSNKLTVGSFASPIDVTTIRQYGFEIHYSGNDYNVTGIRSRAQLITTDTTVTAQGALLQAANNDGIDAGVLNGALIEAIGKSDVNAATITVMRGALINTEWGDYDTITNLKTLHVRTHSRNAAGAGSFGTGYGIYIENEAVGGNGQAWDAGIYFKGTNLSAGNKAFTYGIDFTGGTFGSEEIKLANGSVIGSGKVTLAPTTDSTTFFQILDAAGAVVGNFDTTNKRFGIGTATSDAILGINKPSMAIGDKWLSGQDSGVDYFYIKKHANNRVQFWAKENLYFLIEGATIFYKSSGVKFTMESTGNDANIFQSNGPFHIRTVNDPLPIIFEIDSVEKMRVDADGSILLQGTTSYFIFRNSTHENTDGGRESRIIFKGEQGVDPYPETELAMLEVSHDGTGDDQLGKMVVSINTGAGLVEGWRLDSLLRFGIATTPTARLHLPAGVATAGLAPLKLTSGTDLTTPEAGVIEYDGTHFSVTEVVDRRVLSVASDSITTAVTVADTVSEITVFTAPISADELHVGKVFRIYGFGQASTHDANDTLTIRIKIGGTLLTELGAIPGQTADDPFHFVNTITIRTTGGGGTIASHGHIMIKTTEVHENDQDVVVDTTEAENITVTFQWNDANAGNTATLDQCFLEVLV